MNLDHIASITGLFKDNVETFVNCHLSTVNCQLSTVNCQLSTVPLYSELLAAALRYRYVSHKVFPHG
ncbi:hypothetical protein, partial [Dolichospermum planctonicum]|uniref:hypothetical protein n=1 Tax=Dolichospermum planctonicum TaxID=136072 RepID=UPI001F301259